MPDICDLILDDHTTFRRRFADLDVLRAKGAGAEACAGAWGPLADLLEVHAAAEEEMFYPRLLREGADGGEETRDGVSDHNEIRDAIRAAGSREPGSDGWWEAVVKTREANSDHIAEEERGALPDFRTNAPDAERERLGVEWLAFRSRHAGGRDVDTSDRDVDRYVEQA